MKPTIPVVVLACVLAGCGKQAHVDVESDAWVDGIAGTYVMDARRTLGKTIPGPEGKPIPLTDETLAEIQAGHGAQALRYVLKDDNTFDIFSGSGETAFHMTGIWEETPKGVALEYKTVNGEAPPPEMLGVKEQYTTERGYLIGEQAGKTVYMMKLKPTE